MALREILNEAAFRLRAGPVRTVRWLADRIFDPEADRQFGIRSSGGVSDDVTKLSDEFVRYQPVSYRDMREILDALTIGPHDVFLDLGAGMGRAVLLAAAYRFRRVMGVEISGEQCAIARRNIESLQSKLLCRELTIIEADAAGFHIPDDVTVFFLFNPFTGSVLRKAIGNIVDSLERAPREATLIFYGTLSIPKFRSEVEKFRGLGLKSDVVLSTGARAVIYGTEQAARES